MTLRTVRPVGDDLPDGDRLTDEQAREVAYRRLAQRPRTRAELHESLLARGATDQVAESVLDHLEQLGLVDDAAFAAEWVRSRRDSRGTSARLLEVELHRRGVPDDVAASAVAHLDTEDERQTALDLARQRLDRVTRRGGEVDEREARRVAHALQRRGYGAGLAWSVVREATGLLADVDIPDDIDDIPDPGTSFT